MTETGRPPGWPHLGLPHVCERRDSSAIRSCSAFRVASASGAMPSRSPLMLRPTPRDIGLSGRVVSDCVHNELRDWAIIHGFFALASRQSFMGSPATVQTSLSLGCSASSMMEVGSLKLAGLLSSLLNQISR